MATLDLFVAAKVQAQTGRKSPVFPPSAGTPVFACGKEVFRSRDRDPGPPPSRTQKPPKMGVFGVKMGPLAATFLHPITKVGVLQTPFLGSLAKKSLRVGLAPKKWRFFASLFVAEKCLS